MIESAGMPELGKGVDVLTLHPEVNTSQNRGRTGNLNSVIDAHYQGNQQFWESLSGKSVLLRPNIVDPKFLQGCSHPEAVECVLERLINAGVTRIDIGDLSSANYFEDNPHGNPQLIYQEVIDRLATKYEGIALSLVDLRNFSRDRLSETGLPIIDTSQYAALVDLALPKEHGQYYFSCGTKHLMGLVEPTARPTYFHDDYSLEAEKRISRDHDLMEEIYRDTDEIVDNDQRNREIKARKMIAASYEFDQANMEKMARFIQETVNHLAKKGTPILTVVDGYETLTGQEHSGVLTKTDFAIAGLNPLAVDLAAARRIGILGQAGYLTELSHLVKPEMIGDQLPAAPPYQLKRVPTDFQTLPDRSFRFAQGVVRR